MLKENLILTLEHVGSKVSRDSLVENQEVVFVDFSESNAMISH